tara:strand:- start:3606 stop:4055 length:450 start_codon:yes stop_codon:yes gene_type:complete
MKNLKKLYQQVLLDHNKNPRNFTSLENPTHYAHGVNPLCGDDYHLFLQIENQIVKEVGFTGSGCAISKSVSSMMSQHIKGKSVKEIIKIKDAFIEMLTENLTASEAEHLIGHLTLFENVKEFPIRVKCATLIWRALEAALNNNKKATTE